MDKKLERFLKAIDFNTENYKYFEDAKIDDVLLNKKINRMTLKISNSKTIPLDIFKEFYDKGMTFDGADIIRYKFKV